MLEQFHKKLIQEWKLIKPEIIWCDNIRTFITVYVACKVVKAKVILNTWSESEGKIAWIVYRIGLSSKSYFSRLFKDEYEISPSEYRACQRSMKMP